MKRSLNEWTVRAKELRIKGERLVWELRIGQLRGWITKNGHHIYIEDSGGKSGGRVDKSGKSGIIEPKGDKMLKVSTGGRRNDHNLTETQIAEANNYAISLGMPEDCIYYVDYDFTGYGANFDLLRIGTDVYPCVEHQKNANSNVSMHGAIAHEIIGHRAAALAGKTQKDDVLEEVQASIRAAKFTADLTSSERITLYRDALTRLRNSNIKLRDVKSNLYIYEE